jgi:hypothetical protein
MVNKALREINTDSIDLDKIFNGSPPQWLDSPEVP